MAQNPHLERLFKGKEHWNRWREEEPSARPDLSGADVTDKDFSEYDFTRAIMNDCRFRGCKLRNCKFDHTSLVNLRMSNTDCTGSTIEQSDMKQAELKRSTFDDTVFRHTILSDAKIHECDFVQSQFEDSILSSTEINQSKFSDSRFSEVQMTSLKAELTDFSNGDFHNKVDMKNGVFEKCKFVSANLEYLNAGSAKFSRSDFTAASLKNADCHQTSFDDCILAHTKFVFAQLSGSNFDGASCVSADFKGTDFSQANLSHADFTDAILQRANMQSVNFTHANLRRANLTTCKFGNNTFYETQFAHVKNLEFTEGLFDQDDHGKAFKFDYTFGQRGSGAWLQNHTTWDWLRKVGNFPFGQTAHYVLLSIPVVAYLITIWNGGIKRLVALARTIETNEGEVYTNEFVAVAQYILRLAENETIMLDIPVDTQQLFLATLFLTIATLIYRINCPEIIREFSESQWVFQNQKSRVQYTPLAWTKPRARFFCAVFYSFGAALGALYVVRRLWSTFDMLFLSNGV